MTIVRKVDGVWQPFVGAPQVVQAMVGEKTVIEIFHDGTRNERSEPCEPYPVQLTVDPNTVARLVAEGTWGDVDLGPLGLLVAAPFEVPEGKRTVGAPSYVEDGDVVREIYSVEDIPPPPPPLTAAERLANADLSVDDLKTLLGLE